MHYIFIRTFKLSQLIAIDMNNCTGREFNPLSTYNPLMPMPLTGRGCIAGAICVHQVEFYENLEINPLEFSLKSYLG